ncbi:Phosphatidylinositol 3,4,5-trisphosphate-dependent Rac exchanger 1 protein, partial [Sciurus carolinensis]|nr:Phosphatidylinositol 3,4,5-trisphosphate-dependent Rac exchanger 1 protein [Sciurus carolinensis]
GSNLTDICTQLLLRGTLLKISVGNIQERAFFMFNNLLVYCKWKSRGCLLPSVFQGHWKEEDHREDQIHQWLPVHFQGLNQHRGHGANCHSNGYNMTNDWKTQNISKNKWFMCMAKMVEEKHKWLNAIICEWGMCESLKLDMEKDTYIMIPEKAGKLHHLMMSKNVNLIKDRLQAEHHAQMLPGQGSATEGSQQALKVVFYLNGYHFSKLPSCQESRASFRLYTVLFKKALENVEGPLPPGRQAAEDLQQEINAQSLENIQQYYCKFSHPNLEALAADDSAFMQNCGWLMAMSIAIMIMSQYDFCHIFNTKLESIDQRTTCYQQFAAQLKSRVSPTIKQAALEPHVLCGLNFWPTNCHVNLMKVFNPKMTSSMGRSFSIQFGCKPSLIGLDPKQDGKNQLLLDLLKMHRCVHVPRCTSEALLAVVIHEHSPGGLFCGQDAEVQLHRYAKFCQALVATMCTFSEQLLEALSYGYNNNGEYEESSKEERAMLEDIWVTLSELDSVTFSFKQLDENCVTNTNVFYHIEGRQQTLKVVFYLNGYHFSKLPCRQEDRASLQPHTVLFTKGRQIAEDLQQEINAQSLKNVQQYYHKLRTFYLEPLNLPMDASTTAMKIDQLICSINALDELCHLVKSFMHSKPGTSRSMGPGLLPVSSELCYHLGACQIAMCSTGMQRSIRSVSLEQVAVLAQNHGLLPKCIMQTTDMQKQKDDYVASPGKKSLIFMLLVKILDKKEEQYLLMFSKCQ